MDDFSFRLDSARECPGVDREHDVIVKAMAGLHNAILEGRGAQVIVPLVDLLARFCAEHFEHEEAMMRDCEYAGLDVHAAAHDNLLRAVTDLQRRSREDVLPTIVDTMELLGRLSAHTNEYDRVAVLSIQDSTHRPGDGAMMEGLPVLAHLHAGVN